MSPLRPDKLLATTIILYGGLFLLALVFTGAGHGSLFFAEALVAPFKGLPGLAMWPAIAGLLVFRRYLACRILAAIALLIHYYGIWMLVIETEWYYVDRVWKSGPAQVAIFCLIYFAGQVGFWTVILWRRKHA